MADMNFLSSLNLNIYEVSFTKNVLQHMQNMKRLYEK